MSTTIQVTTYSTIILDNDDIDTIFEDHNLTIDQKKEFLENHDNWMDSYEALDFNPMEEESNLVITKLAQWNTLLEPIVLCCLALLLLVSH